MSFVAGIALTAITFIPAFQSFFGTTSLTMAEFAISVGCAVAIIPIVEVQKLIERAIYNKKQNRINLYKDEQTSETNEQN